MPELDAPGALLHYEAVGSGPVLFCIHGGDGSGEIWRRLSGELKDRFTVVFYDRRGFSQSYLTGAQDYAHRLETDADDAALLIKHVSPTAPATVIGNSSGAIVALKLLARHPEIIHTLLAYEPPAYRFLPDAEPAFERFLELVKADEGMKMAMQNMRMDDVGRNYNVLDWMEREVLYYPGAAWDVDVELRPYREKLILVNGELSNEEASRVRANVALAGMLGSEVVIFPGGHVGHASHAEDFARRLVEVLEARGG
ncbi:hypothetical protein Q7P37_009036 [Cladosporium fusiforme]